MSYCSTKKVSMAPVVLEDEEDEEEDEDEEDEESTPVPPSRRSRAAASKYVPFPASYACNTEYDNALDPSRSLRRRHRLGESSQRGTKRRTRTRTLKGLVLALTGIRSRSQGRKLMRRKMMRRWLICLRETSPSRKRYLLSRVDLYVIVFPCEVFLFSCITSFVFMSLQPMPIPYPQFPFFFFQSSRIVVETRATRNLKAPQSHSDTDARCGHGTGLR